MTFKIKADLSFINYRNKLALSKRVLLDSKISFLEQTGFMGNCKILSNGIFEFSISQLNDSKTYCIMDNGTNTIVFSSDLNETQRIKNESQSNTNSENTIKLESLQDIKNNSLKDIKYAKTYFNQIMSSYGEDNEADSFLMNELKNIFNIQGKDNFENISGFDFSEINSTKSLETVKDLQNRIKLITKIKSIDYLVNKSGISANSIQSILKIKEDISLKDLNSLKVFFSKSSI